MTTKDSIVFAGGMTAAFVLFLLGVQTQNLIYTGLGSVAAILTVTQRDRVVQLLSE